MRYRWKPNASQKAEYKQRCEERNTLPIISSNYPIREGCYVRWYSLSKGDTLCGTVVNSSYGTSKGQHTFTIDTGNEKILVKGRNLYPNLLVHIPGEISKAL